MSEEDSGSAPPAPTAPEPTPPEVGRVAAERGLGALRRAQKGSNPLARFARGMAYAVGWLLGLCGLGLLFQRWDLGPLGLLALPLLVGAAVAVITAVRRLFAGFTATYLYANGLIHTKNGRIQVVTWPEVDKLMVWEIGGRAERYYVVTHDGRKVLVEFESAQGDATLGIMVQEIMQKLGRPIVAAGPSARRLRR
jgi:hypothetical protein